MHVLTGIVAKVTPAFVRVDCPDAPFHLQVHYLTPADAAEAGVGDSVKLAFTEQPAGPWPVSAVRAWRVIERAILVIDDPSAPSTPEQRQRVIDWYTGPLLKNHDPADTLTPEQCAAVVPTLGQISLFGGGE